MGRDEAGNGTPRIVPSSKAAPGPRTKTVLTGRDGLPARVDDTADEMGGAQRVSDRELLEAVRELTQQLRELREFLFSQVR